jgi:hypothetical protein
MLPRAFLLAGVSGPSIEPATTIIALRSGDFGRSFQQAELVRNNAYQNGSRFDFDLPSIVRLLDPRHPSTAFEAAE